MEISALLLWKYPWHTRRHFCSYGTDILPRLSPLYRVVKKLNAIIQTAFVKCTIRREIKRKNIAVIFCPLFAF